MSSVKKSEKSRKSKASVAKSAAKSRYSGAKANNRSSNHKARSASMPRTARAASKSAAKRAQTAKAKAPARKPAATASKTAAAKARAARARLKKLAAEQAAAKAAAARKAAERAATKSSAGHARSKVTQTPASHGKASAERTVAQAKAPRVAERQGAVTHPSDAKRPTSVHRAQAQAVLALRAAAAKPAAPARKEEMSKPTIVSKSQKKPAEIAPAPARPAPPLPAPPVAAKPPAPAAEAKPAAPAAKPAKPMTAAKLGFKPMEFIVYPAHGVGQILAVEEQEVAGFKLELFVISFAKDKMILKVPTPKTISVGMRKLASAEVIKRALDTLTGRARIKRTMWSRRAQEYEAKINSGDLVAIAEVVRDLYRSEAQPEQSYSERQLYEAALDRVSREIASVQKLTETEALKLIESQLQKSPRRGKAEGGEADIDSESNEGDVDEGSIEEAA